MERTTEISPLVIQRRRARHSPGMPWRALLSKQGHRALKPVQPFTHGQVVRRVRRPWEGAAFFPPSVPRCNDRSLQRTRSVRCVDRNSRNLGPHHTRQHNFPMPQVDLVHHPPKPSGRTLHRNLLACCRRVIRRLLLYETSRSTPCRRSRRAPHTCADSGQTFPPCVLVCPESLEPARTGGSAG